MESEEVGIRRGWDWMACDWEGGREREQDLMHSPQAGRQVCGGSGADRIGAFSSFSSLLKHSQAFSSLLKLLKPSQAFSSLLKPSQAFSSLLKPSQASAGSLVPGDTARVEPQRSSWFMLAAAYSPSTAQTPAASAEGWRVERRRGRVHARAAALTSARGEPPTEMGEGKG